MEPPFDEPGESIELDAVGRPAGVTAAPTGASSTCAAGSLSWASTRA